MRKINQSIKIIGFITLFIILVFLIKKCCVKDEILSETQTQTIIATKVDTIFVDNVPKIDNPTPYINQDSIDRVEFIKDSIAFRKSVKIINGGYNGFADRYSMWLRARNELKKQTK